MKIYLVDAFTEIPYKGNPAGVCIIDEYPCAETMQRMAGYYGWSEIAFVRPLGQDRFQIRWFSPLDEAPLCGHATLAATHVLFNEGYAESGRIKYVYKDGELAATMAEGRITMDFPAKPVKRCRKVPFSVNKVLGIKAHKEVFKDDLVYVVVLNSKEDVINADPDFNAIKALDCRSIAITAKGDAEFDFYSRYFAPSVGINEDPVCGSMHCRLVCYWSSILGRNKFCAFQASRRTGRLKVELIGNRVTLSGRACTVCKIDVKSWPDAKLF